MAIQRIQSERQPRLKRRLFTLDEYERMIEAGVFNEDEHIELIGGEIVEMAPIGIPHMACVARLTRLLTNQAGDKALVWPQNNSIRLPVSNSRPEPDVALLRWRDDFYGGGHPATASDALLVVEVAETSTKHDREVKGRLYAQAGIPEYWIVNLRGKAIEVYTDPVEGAYRQMKQAKSGETLALPSQLGTVAVSDILGEKVV